MIEFGEHKLIIVGFDEYGEIFFIELGFQVLEGGTDVVVEGQSAFVEVILQLEKYASGFATNPTHLLYLH